MSAPRPASHTDRLPGHGGVCAGDEGRATRAAAHGCAHLAFAACICVLVIVVAARLAEAYSSARMIAVDVVLRHVRMHDVIAPWAGGPDMALLLQAWRSAGISTADMGSRDLLFRQECRALGSGGPGDEQAAPGDFAFYDEADAEHPSRRGARRVAMFVSRAEVVVVDDDGHAALIPRAEISGDVGAADLGIGQHAVRAVTGTYIGCRLPPQAWPDGDREMTHGRVALVDVADASRQGVWAAHRPVDADQGVWHRAGQPVAVLLAVVSGTLGDAVRGVVAVGEAGLDRVPIVGPAVVSGLGLLGTTFDGRGAHALLTEVMSNIGGPCGFGLVDRFVAATGLPVLSGLAATAQRAGTAVTSTLVSILLGIDDSRSVTVASVLFAAVTDAALVLEPAALLHLAGLTPGTDEAAVAGGTRLVDAADLGIPLRAGGRAGAVLHAVAAEEGGVLAVAGHLGDVTMLRPSAVEAALRESVRLAQGLAAKLSGGLHHTLDHLPFVEPLSPGGRSVTGMTAWWDGTTPAWASAASGMEGEGLDLALRSARRATDLASLLWRPSSVTGDMIGHAAAASGLLADPPPALEAALQRLSGTPWPVLEDALRQQARVLEAMDSLTHRHSGARTLGAMMNGTGPQTVAQPAPVEDSTEFVPMSP